MGKAKRKRAGRPRKEGVNRYPNGSIVNHERGETEKERMATVLAYRAREVGQEHAAKPEAGYELGRIFLAGRITQRQHEGGVRWARTVDRYAKMNGFPSPFPKAMDWGNVGGGMGCGSEPSSVLIRATANDYMRAQTKLAVEGRAAMVACREACILETDTGAWPEHTMAALRAGLSSLADFYGIERA